MDFNKSAQFWWKLQRNGKKTPSILKCNHRQWWWWWPFCIWPPRRRRHHVIAHVAAPAAKSSTAHGNHPHLEAAASWYLLIRLICDFGVFAVVMAGGDRGRGVECHPHQGVSAALLRPGPQALAASWRRRETVVRSDFAAGGVATMGDSPQALSGLQPPPLSSLFYFFSRKMCCDVRLAGLAS